MVTVYDSIYAKPLSDFCKYVKQLLPHRFAWLVLDQQAIIAMLWDAAMATTDFRDGKVYTAPFTRRFKDLTNVAANHPLRTHNK